MSNNKEKRKWHKHWHKVNKAIRAKQRKLSENIPVNRNLQPADNDTGNCTENVILVNANREDNKYSIPSLEEPVKEDISSLLPVLLSPPKDSICEPIISTLQTNVDNAKYQTRLTLDELLDLDLSSLEDLLEDLIPFGAISMLAGKGGVGKSMLYLQLSLAITHGYKEFIGKKITAQYNSVLIIATEDSKKVLSKRANKQFKKMVPEGIRSKKLIIHISGENLLETLRNEFKHEKFDLVVLDALCDILKEELNSAIATRNFCNELEKLIREFGTSFMLIHHESKSQYKNARDRILGSTAIVDRCRSVFILSKDNKTGIRTLTIEKANDLSDEKIGNPIKLRFDPETFTFSLAGDYDVTTDINAETSKASEISKQQQAKKLSSNSVTFKSREKKPGRKRDEVKFLKAHEMHKEGLAQVEISKILGVNKATVCRWLKENINDLGKAI